MKTSLRWAAAAVCALALAGCPDINFRSDLVALMSNSSTPVSATPTVSIVYNDLDTTDTTQAQALHALLTNNLTFTSGVSGTMPVYVVNMVPQGNIPASFDSTWSLAGVIVVTPGSTVYSDAARSRNLAAQGKGVIAMGNGGTRFIDTVNANWSTWGLSGQQPGQIGYSRSSNGGGVDAVFSRGTGNPGPDLKVWRSPLTSTSLPTTDAVSVTLYSATPNGLEIHFAGLVAPIGGSLIGDDAGNANWFVIVRQGRFLQYGFSLAPDLPKTGQVLFVNLVAMMMDY
jgi:hypothetical protein